MDKRMFLESLKKGSGTAQTGIQIKNLRVERPKEEWEIKVDRSSILGYPFPMNGEAERDAVCDQYEEYFRRKVREDAKFKEEVDRLIALWQKHGKLSLFCWCAPKRCHSETIKKFIEENA